MLDITPSKSGASAVRYFDDSLSLGDYYGIAEPGQWHGLGAARLGLHGKVSRQDFADLALNRKPGTKDRLTIRTKRKPHCRIRPHVRCTKERVLIFS
jgi:TrwC relaxase